MNRWFTRFVLVGVVILSGCQGVSPTPAARPSQTPPASETPTASTEEPYQEVSPAVLSDWLDKKDFVLVNVHIPFAGNLPHTDLSIPYDQIEPNLDKLPASKDAKIVLYCSSGHMSGIAAKKLASLGYTNVWDLTGGMSAWRKTGFSLVDTP